MYHAVRSQEAKKLLSVEGPSLLLAIGIAGTFYKFGSFILELVAFLPTWFLISLVISKCAQRLGLISESS